MLIIPLEKSINWRKPPVVTFLLILINTIILLFTNPYNEKTLTKAFDYYLNSELPKIELPYYIKTQPNVIPKVNNEELIAAIQNNSIHKNIIFHIASRMESDENFMRNIHQDKIITQEEAIYPKWKSERNEFEQIFHSTTNDRYGFTPAKHKAITFITHQFLHGGYDHLIGNMIFLFLIGVTLETALGGLLYFSCYLISGLGAVALYWLAYSTSEANLVGASGAISGLMGMYAGVFGLRKIRFFYSVLFYFDFVKAPALIMLPIWMLNEIYQLLFMENSHVAYMAHLGGLLSGGLISFTIKQYFVEKIDTQYLDESAKQDEKAKNYEAGMKLLGELKFPQAQRVFSKLSADYPDDFDILMQYYKTLKYTDKSQEYDKAVNKIFAASSIVNIKEVVSVFKDHAKLYGIKETPNNLLVKLAALFAKSNYQNEAGFIISKLMAESVEIEGVDQALFVLATAWKRAGNMEKYAACLKLLVKHYANRAIGNNAKKLLAELS
jgi:membrane associated rhomboid family serine protease